MNCCNPNIQLLVDLRKDSAVTVYQGTERYASPITASRLVEINEAVRRCVVRRHGAASS